MLGAEFIYQYVYIGEVSLVVSRSQQLISGKNVLSVTLANSTTAIHKWL